MNEFSDAYAVPVLKSWFERSHGLFERYAAVFEFKDSGHGSARVGLETDRYLAEICVWNHASCLDIQIIELKSEKSTFPHIGSCETRSDFESHLQKFIEWFVNEYRKTT